jgi:glycosyltransferase involved in cell wall biosynthesis
VKSVEIVADLRRADPEVAADIVRRWAAEDPSAEFIRCATFAVSHDAVVGANPLPAGWRVVTSRIPAGFWEATLSAAGRESHAVLILLAPPLPCLEATGVMLDLLDEDAMYGAVVARTQCGLGCCLQTLSGTCAHPAEWMPHESIAELPSHELVGDVLAHCTLLKPVTLTEFGETDHPFHSLAGALLHRVASARRCGFRTVVANRAVVRLPGADCTRPPSRVSIPDSDVDRLRVFDNDMERGWKEFRGASTALFERLTGHHLKALRGIRRPSLLLDMRNVGSTYNGTSFAAVGTALGLHRAAIDWDVAILANPEGARFHEFESLFPGWTVYTAQPPSDFNVALRLSQPWHIQEMIDLHLAARVNAYLMLDTICWDVVYVAPPHLEGTWQFLAASADGLFFISDFSRQRFRARFPASARTPDVVCHLSFDPSDYTRPELLTAAESEYVLVVGNHLEHKDVSATADLLASAFPLMQIETLGPTRWRSPRVTTHTSGKLAELEVQRLYASARLTVFPSFYEGFGLPVVTALAYGRLLFARASHLLDEVASHCQPRGRLIAYRQRDELVELIGRLLHGEPVAEVVLGTALNGERPRSWLDVGHQVDKSLRRLMATASTTAWRAREGLIRQAVAYRI